MKPMYIARRIRQLLSEHDSKRIDTKTLRTELEILCDELDVS